MKKNMLNARAVNKFIGLEGKVLTAETIYGSKIYLEELGY